MTERVNAHNPLDAENEIKMIDEAAEYLRGRGVEAPEVAVILGTGLGAYADRLENAIQIPYGEIPGFMVSTAPSHKGALYYGTHLGKKVLIMSGRFHCYEGYRMYDTVFPVRVMARLGVKRLVVTNAAGAIDPKSQPGDLMLIRDHINMSGANPLTGANLDELGPRFPDVSDAYTKSLRSAIKAGAAEAGIRLPEGVYAMMAGPSFETPAEIKFLRVIGADAVGMSTVPEVITAAHAGIEVAAISCLSNMAAGVAEDSFSSHDVEKTAAEASARFAAIVDIAVAAVTEE